MRELENKEKRFTLNTKNGCRNVLSLLLAVILVCSFFANLVESSWTSVKIQNIKFDARGAIQDADLYTPVGTNSHSNLPCVILSHGGGCTNGVLTGIAQELARRGFVVLNVSSYGAGLSGQPMYDEDDYGVEKMQVGAQGLLDAVNYVRTLKFVDQTRIAVGGHSQGAYRSAIAALDDCTYFTINDLMINFMHEQFGIAFTEAEIDLDAEALAKKYLTPDQKAFYDNEYLVNLDYWNTRIKAVIPIGSLGVQVRGALKPETVQVAGYDVTRYLQTNIGLVCGEWDHNFGRLSDETFSTSYFQTGNTIHKSTWLQLSDTGTADMLGSFDNISVAASNALSSAVENRSTRILVGIPNTSHSGEFMSIPTTTAIIQYAQEALNHNSQISPKNIVWLWREYLNTAAMIAMIGVAATLCALLSKQKYFSGIVNEHDDNSLMPFKKWTAMIYWLASVAIVAYAYYYAVKRGKGTFLIAGKFFPLDGTSSALYDYLFVTAIGFLLLVAIISFVNKKQLGSTKLNKLGIRIGAKNILKSLLVSFIILILCYTSMAVTEYLFGQDYRWWMCVFTKMQLFHWALAVRYLLVILPCYFLICCGINYIYTSEGDKKPVKDIAITVIVGSLGIYINHLIYIISAYTGSDASTFTLKLVSAPSIIGGLLMFVPLSVFIARKTYKLTGSVWVGTFVNSFLTVWMWTSAISGTNVYMGTTIIEKIFGF